MNDRDEILAALDRVIARSKAYVANKESYAEYLQNEKDCLKLRLSKVSIEDIEGLHSELDMDIEDEIGRPVTLEESRMLGIMLKQLIRAITMPDSQEKDKA